MASLNEATLRGRTIISTTHRPKNIGVNETANSENILKTGMGLLRRITCSMGDLLTFHVIRKSTPNIS